MAKKGFEIAYALIRLAGGQKSLFGEKLENAGFELIGSVTTEDSQKIHAIGRLIEYLICLGTEAKKVSERNMDIVLKELEALESVLGQLQEDMKLQDVDITGLFIEKRQRIRQSKKSPANVELVSEDSAKETIEAESVLPANKEMDPAMKAIYPATIAGSVSAGIRQSLIIQKIRETDQCGFKDIEEALSGTSERTIRYDLENLVKNGIIERLGTGPGTLYRVRRPLQAA